MMRYCKLMGEQYLFFCRHGYRDDLTDNSYQFNPGLTTLGIAQSKLLAKELKKYSISKIIASPYIRTLETAKIISEKLGKCYAIDCCIGEWLNVEWMSQMPKLYTQDEISERYPMARFDKPLVNIDYLYPENIQQFKMRCLKTAEAINALSDSVLFVTHGRVLSEICANLTHTNENNFQTDICCLTILKRNDSNEIWEIVLNGSIEHITKYIKIFQR